MEKTKSFWKTTCDEAALICDKSQYKESSFFEKIKLNLHILTCKICKQYVRQNTVLTKIYKKQAHLCKKVTHEMNDKDKESLKRELQKVGS